MYYACNYMKQNVYFYSVGIYIVQWMVYLEIINIKYYLKTKQLKVVLFSWAERLEIFLVENHSKPV